MANKKKNVYVLLLNVPKIGIQLLGSFNTTDEANKYIEDHKAFLNAAYEESKKNLSVSFTEFERVVGIIQDSNPPKDEDKWKEHVKAILAKEAPDYEYDVFVKDLQAGKRITKLYAMCNISRYNVYETVLGEAKHQLPQNL
jgi:hypothetical protein